MVSPRTRRHPGAPAAIPVAWKVAKTGTMAAFPFAVATMDPQQFADLAARLERLARDDPPRYLRRVFGVAALGFLILGLVIGMALVNLLLIAGLVVLVVATGGKALVFFAKLGKLLVVLAIPAWAMLRATATLVLARFPRPQGRELARADAPALFARLDAMRERLGGPRVHRVLLTDELNAAIVQHPRFGLFGWEENTLILGLRLLEALGEDEAMAVVAHEYGHLAGHHSRFGGFIYRFRVAWGRLQELSQRWNDWGSRLIARVFRWYAPRFNAYTFALARQNEYLADRTSVELVGAGAAADALMRSSIAARFESAGFWPEIDRRVAALPEPPAERSAIWADALRARLDGAQRARYLEEARSEETDGLDTHPALADRLAAIGAQADADAALRLAAPSRSAAEAWFGDRLGGLRAEFDRAWADAIGERWRERHAELARLAARAAELEALPGRDPAQQWEYLNAVAEVDPERDLLPLVEALLAAEPGHVSALYRRGCLRLERGDARGIDDLERVMAADADATLAACAAVVGFYAQRDAAGDAERADAWRARWRTRAAYEEAVRAELAALPPDATLAEAGLPPETLEAVCAVLRSSPKHLRRVYLLRRVLKADPAVHDFVLAVETARFTLGDKGPAVCRRLAGLDWPLAMFVVHLGSPPYRRFRKAIRKLGARPLEWQG